ncbi:MAG: LuxR C-terminal-related transcriptional regulator [Actinomycetota bacterium]|nr:LuxR C-terminal-related transcriptional regulator [Actinomycetota bacterium]
MRPHLATIEHWPLFAHVIALADLGLGQPARSDLTLKHELRDRRRASITSLTGAMLSATRATLLLADGKATEAAELLATAPATSQTRVARARVALLSGEAERVIATVAGIDLDALSPRLFAELQLLHASAAQHLGHADAARAALGSAIAALTEYGMRHPLALVRGSDRRALAELATPAERALLLDDRIPELLPRDVSMVALTHRERAVLERLALGGTLPEIAAELHISVNTLKTQLRAVYRKLGVGDREAALVAAARHGLLRG